MPPDTSEQRKPRLQQHQLNMLYTCPQQYYHRYVMDRKTAPGLALITGSATHCSAEKNLQHKIDTGGLLDEDQVTDIARDTANQIWDEDGVLLSPEEKAEGESVIRGQTVDQAVELARLHHRELAPQLEPIAVERTFLLELDGYPVNLAGTIDVEEATRLRDLKTYKKSPTQKSVDSNLQLSLYSWAKETIDGARPKELCFDVALKKKTPELKTFRTVRSDRDYDTLFRRIDLAVKTIESGIFNPCSPDAWVCSHDWCGYYDDICEFGRRGRSTVFLPASDVTITKVKADDGSGKQSKRRKQSGSGGPAEAP